MREHRQHFNDGCFCVSLGRVIPQLFSDVCLDDSLSTYNSRKEKKDEKKTPQIFQQFKNKLSLFSSTCAA